MQLERDHPSAGSPGSTWAAAGWSYETGDNLTAIPNDVQ